MQEADGKQVYEKPELIDFEHWMAQIIKGDSCIGGVMATLLNHVEPQRMILHRKDNNY